MRRHIFFASLALVLAACSEDEEALAPRLTSPATAVYNASCQTDTIRFDASTHWTATSDAGWLTLVQQEGTGNGRLPIYIEQNDDEQLRRATITITFDNEERSTLKVQITQCIPSENGTAYVDLPKNFGLGWGYDLKVDIADVSGIRGQVFNGQNLIRDYDDPISVENCASTDLYLASGNSHEEMQSQMGASFAGSADILIASAKVSMEYSNQIKEKKDRRYVWCRTTKTVKLADFDSSVDVADKYLVRWCTTESFRKAVNECSPKDFVQRFGTHLITTSILGGKLDYYFTVSQTVKTEVERIITHINVKLLFFKKSWTEVDEKTWTDIQRDFQARYEVTGGGKIGQTLNEKLKVCGEQNVPLDDPTLFDKWNACFENPNTVNPDDLTMVGFDVIPIWYVVETINQKKAEAIRKYVLEEYLK